MTLETSRDGGAYAHGWDPIRARLLEHIDDTLHLRGDAVTTLLCMLLGLSLILAVSKVRILADA